MQIDYKYITSFILGLVMSYFLLAKQVEPITFQAKVDTKTVVQTKVKTKTVVTNKCQAVITEKPDGTKTTVITADTNTNATTDTNAIAETDTKLDVLIKPLQAHRGLSLGVSTSIDIKDPLRVSKDLLTFYIGIPFGTSWRVISGYRLNNTYSIGVSYEW